MKLLKFSLIDWINLSFVFIIFLFYLKAFPYTPYKIEPPLIFSFLIGLVLFAVYIRSNSSKKIKQIFLLSYPVIFLFVIFETFFMILPYFNPMQYDNILNNIDFNMLGVYPTVWIEKFYNPIVSDILYLCYLFYFPMPLFLLVYLYRKKQMRDLDKVVFSYLSTYYISYVIYFFVPAMGPRFNETLLPLQQIKSLDGLFISIPIQNLINFLEPNKFDAFPSLHSAILTTTMLSTYIYHKKLFKIFIPVAIGIFIALVYCRYHYVIDIIVGFLISITIFFLSRWLYEIIAKKTQIHPFVY